MNDARVLQPQLNTLSFVCLMLLVPSLYPHTPPKHKEQTTLHSKSFQSTESSQSPSPAGRFPPDDNMAGDALPASWRYFLRAVGAFVVLLFLWHFFTHQRRGFRSFSARASPLGSFFRNFFSTYFTLIQASLSCLGEEQHQTLHRVTPLPYSKQLQVDEAALAQLLNPALSPKKH